MTSREQFEDKFEEITGWEADEHPDRNYVDVLWGVWQASREEIEVELPSIEDKKWSSSWHGKFREEAFWLEVKRRLVKLGLKVKQ